MEELKSDPGYIPAISVEAPSSGEHGFPWNIFYTKIGKELNEPLLDKKIKDRTKGHKNMVANVTTNSSVGGLRQAIEEALGHRRTSLLIVDEAMHLVRRSKGEALITKMETLKSLANIHGTTLLLVGSYDLYKLMNLTGQVARRSALVHFKRYSSECEDEVENFNDAVNLLQEALPIKNVPDFKIFNKRLMVPCVGCVGILKETFQRSLVIALQAYDGNWNDMCLQRALLSKAQIQTIEQETRDGEESIKNATFEFFAFDHE